MAEGMDLHHDTDLDEMDNRVIDILAPMFPQLPRKFIKLSVSHPSNRVPPLEEMLLLQRCIDDLLELRTLTEHDTRGDEGHGNTVDAPLVVEEFVEDYHFDDVIDLASGFIEPSSPVAVHDTHDESGHSRKRINYSEDVEEADKPKLTAMAGPDEAPKSSTVPAEFRKGAFVMEKRFLDSVDDHPIWKIDAGKLLQKFEPTVFNGEKCHKAMCTYSSWTDTIEQNYMLIHVTQKDKETVQMNPAETRTASFQEKYLPKFNVYLQILLSQALEPGFLLAIQDEGDEYYMEPLNTVDSLVEEKRAKLLDGANWKSEFLEQIESYPCLEVKEMRGLTNDDRCQACTDSEMRAEKMVRLSGQPYDGCTLEPQGGDRTQEFAISGQVAEVLPTIHSLHHVKHFLFTECSGKLKSLRKIGAGADDSEVLDQCLQNRDWVLKNFKHVASLLGEETKT